MGEWQERVNKRRDERATRAPEGRAKHRAKKNTKKWCKGVEGREHKPECQKGPEIGKWYLEDWRFLVCTTCGKQLDYWTGPKSFLRTRDNPKPEWVTD